MARSTPAATDPVVRDFVENLLPRLRDEWGARHVLLFGSRARGEGDEWSDLDVIVVSDAFEEKRLIDRAPDLFRGLGCPVQVETLCYAPDEFERKRREPGVVATACEEGIWLI